MQTEQIQSVINSLKHIETEHQPSAFACSFGLEDMVLLDLIAKHAPRIEVFTLDTGRLPDETHALLEQVRERYTVPIRLYFPDAMMVENWVAQNGTNGFYRSMSQRKQCCEIRKVLPLGRALNGRKAWITGLRHEQSNARQTLKLQEWDEGNGLHKFNPLVDWTWNDVWAYVKEYKLPYNALHDRGYPSIGCAPCTRAIEPGQEFRAGRWWWEDTGAKECGLHVGPQKGDAKS
jgi:phosphoadenosine phosphosulfate reductase